MRKWILALLVFTVLIGCGDDDPVTPPEFQVTIQVTDPQGQPVEGLDLSLVPDTPFYQDGNQGSGDRPATVIPFQVAQASDIRLAVEDITGAEVRLLGEQPAPMGVHQWMWDGLDDEENRLPSGFYTAHLEVRDPSSGDLLYEHRVHMLMAIIDASRYSVGTSDADGKIVLTDKRLFPQLYDVPDIQATDENADPIGMIQFTPSMRFQLFDLINGGSMRFIEEVDGAGTLEFTWTVEEALAGSQGPAAGPATKVPIPEQTNRLGNVYPCPFN